jgi:hypothetical protein
VRGDTLAATNSRIPMQPKNETNKIYFESATENLDLLLLLKNTE